MQQYSAVLLTGWSVRWFSLIFTFNKFTIYRYSNSQIMLHSWHSHTSVITCLLTYSSSTGAVCSIKQFMLVFWVTYEYCAYIQYTNITTVGVHTWQHNCRGMYIKSIEFFSPKYVHYRVLCKIKECRQISTEKVAHSHWLLL